MAGRGCRRGVLMGRKVIELFCWISSLAILCGVVSSTTYPGDIATLQAIKNSLVDSSNSLSTWGGGDPCGDGWVGVYCISADYPSDLTGSNFSYVTELRLLQLNLKGTLAAEIGDLSALKYLNFMWNQISGTIPTAIGKLKNLSFLLLSGNQLNGALPRELGFLPSLIRMQIDENNVSGQIPDSFAYPNLGKVQHIQLNNNSLDGGIPVGLTNLTTVEHLFLDSNNFTGSLPMQIASMPNLATIQLDNNQFDSIPEQFGTMPNLVRLSLRNCDLRGGIPDFSGSASLAVIDLSHNSLTGSIMNATQSANLTTVDLSSNLLSGTIPDSVGSLISLQILELRGNGITGEIPSNLSVNGQQSTIFDFQNNSITGVANSTDLLGVKGPDGNISVWLSGNPFCSAGPSHQNNVLCVPEDIAAYMDVGRVVSTPMAASPDQNSCSACKAPYALAPLSQSNGCQCALPITVQWQLESPSFYVFDPYVQQLQAYLATGLNVDVNQVQIQNYVYRPSYRLLFTILLFPPGAQFDDSEAARIYSVFANWKLPSSVLFGPYDLISFSVPAKVSSGKSSGLSKAAIVGIVVGVVAFVVLKTLCMYYVLKYWLTWRNKKKGEKPDAKSSRKPTTFKRRSFSGMKVASVKEFTFDEIAKATDNFSDEKLVGEGGYGKVYSGTLEDGQKVAVKRAEEGSYQGSIEFETEIQLLSRVHHKNLVALIGYCNDQGEQVLVYEFVAYGSLLWHLSPAARVPLTFLTRLQIALDSARGIHYLHTQADPPIYHRDVKASNILLDEKFHAKVSDFGLSKLAPQPDLAGMVGYVSTVVKGTPGYLDPEYFKTHRLTDKSDVYSFGVVLLVLVTGQQPITDGKNLVREVNIAYDDGALSRVVDVRIRGAYSQRAMDIITRLALVCCRDNPDERPTIGEVVTQLEDLWKETYYDSSEDGNTADAYSGDLRNDNPRSEDSFFELDPSKNSSQTSSTVWSSSGNPDSGGSVPNINIVNPR
ncbi:unnamed protein product [Calypogeia fissa]